jgi:hypothetical protein
VKESIKNTEDTRKNTLAGLVLEGLKNMSSNVNQIKKSEKNTKIVTAL